MLGLAEERGLGCEESVVFALVIQAAVPTAHAVTAGHGGGQHCVDSHGEVRREPLAPAQNRGSTLTSGSAVFLFPKKGRAEGTLYQSVCRHLTVFHAPRISQRSSAAASHLRGRDR